MPGGQSTFGCTDVRINTSKKCDKLVFNDETGEYEKCGNSSTYVLLGKNTTNYRCKLHAKDSWEDVIHPDIQDKTTDLE